MVSVFMLTPSPLLAAPRPRSDRKRLPLSFSGVLLPVLVSLAVAGCEKVPLMAPVGSTITLTATTGALSANGTADIIAQVLESSGVPPHSGTQVIFTTTLGRIVPQTARTDVARRIIVNFLAGSSNGTATITASSGGATTGLTGAVKISVGTAAVGRVNVSATPSSVSAFGGSTTMTANVVDVNGNALIGAPVAFSTTAGTLSSSSVLTGLDGNALSTLTTSQQAVVTASVGATAPATGGGTGGTGGTTTSGGQASGSVTVTVTATPTLLITPPQTPSAGLPASFTFAVTNVANGAVARSVTVDWGDGSIRQPLGAISGSAVVVHVYNAAGPYTVTAVMLDSAGQTTVQSTSITVIPVASPTIVITPSVPTSCTGAGICNVTFQIQVTPPIGIGIVSVLVDFGDGVHVTNLGGLTGSTQVQNPYAASFHGPAQVTVTVRDTLIVNGANRITQGFTTINLP